MNFHIKKSTSEKNIKYTSIQSIASNTIIQDEDISREQNNNGAIKIISNPSKPKASQNPREDARSLLFDAPQKAIQ